jgi:hypothetical protein
MTFIDNPKHDECTARPMRNQAIAQRALAEVSGSRQWKRYKLQAFEEFAEMADRSERMELLQADLSGDFDVAYRIKQPCPRTPHNGELVVGEEVIYHLHYEESFLFEPPPPWLPLRVCAPRDIWHSNCVMQEKGLPGFICLGDLFGLLVSAPPKEIALAGYFAMALRDISLDVQNPLGVLNIAAVNYYLEHPEYLPLTFAGLFDEWNGWEGVNLC